MVVRNQSETEALQYLHSLSTSHPELLDWCDTLSDLYGRKLWHELTLKLEEFVKRSVFQAGDGLIHLYHKFIIDLETKINLLKLAHLAVIVSRRYSEKEASISYLQGVIERVEATKVKRMDEPILYIKMEIAILNLYKGGGYQKQCKHLLEDGKSTLDSMTDIDPSVYSKYYWASLIYHKLHGSFSEWYMNGLLFLAHTSLESLSDSLKLELAYGLCVSALMGDTMYSFGELLAHPIIQGLLGTELEWLYHFVEAFNSGLLYPYVRVQYLHASSISTATVFGEGQFMLSEKFRILCVMEVIYRRPLEDRTIPLSVIARRTRIAVNNIEYLLMKCLSLHLTEGTIDQVDGTVSVSWAKPRVLGISQIRSLRDRVDEWVAKVHAALVSVEADTPDLVAS